MIEQRVLEATRKQSIVERNIKLTTVGGLAAFAALGIISVPLIGAAINIITLGGYLFMGFAVYKLWPAIVLGLGQASLKAQEALVRLSPLEALELEKQKIQASELEAEGHVNKASGELDAYKRKVDNSKSRLSPEKVKEWEAKYDTRRLAVEDLKNGLRIMRQKNQEAYMLIEEGKAEFALAQPDNSLASAINMANGEPTDSRNFDIALDQIRKISGEASSNFSNSMTKFKEGNK